MGEAGAGGAASESAVEAALPDAGKTSVYISIGEDGATQYVGITDNIEARAAAHLAQKGIEIDPIPGFKIYRELMLGLSSKCLSNIMI